MKRSPMSPRRTPLPRSGNLRARSPKMTRLYVQRRQFVRDTLAERPWCEVTWDDRCTGRAVDCDEILSRAQGGSILDPANTQTTCRACHSAKHENPTAAKDRGLTVQRRAS